MKKKRIINTIAVIVFLAGFASFMVPYVTEYLSDYKADRAIEQYKNDVDKASSGKNATALTRLYDDVLNYNREIYENKQSGLKDQYSYEKSLFDLSDYGIKDNVFGYISIPRLDVELPIYLGATWDNMALGAAQLTYTSIPVDEINTNSVIAGHRGYWGAPFFKYIEDIELGDKITVTNPWGTLTYTVTETRVIKKNEINNILIQDQKTLLTLSTCHPLHRNYQRYLVFAELTGSNQKVY